MRTVKVNENAEWDKEARKGDPLTRSRRQRQKLLAAVKTLVEMTERTHQAADDAHKLAQQVHRSRDGQNVTFRELADATRASQRTVEVTGEQTRKLPGDVDHPNPNG